MFVDCVGGQRGVIPVIITGCPNYAGSPWSVWAEGVFVCAGFRCSIWNIYGFWDRGGCDLQHVKLSVVCWATLSETLIYCIATEGEPKLVLASVESRVRLLLSSRIR